MLSFLSKFFFLEETWYFSLEPFPKVSLCGKLEREVEFAYIYIYVHIYTYVHMHTCMYNILVYICSNSDHKIRCACRVRVHEGGTGDIYIVLQTKWFIGLNSQPKMRTRVFFVVHTHLFCTLLTNVAMRKARIFCCSGANLQYSLTEELVFWMRLSMSLHTNVASTSTQTQASTSSRDRIVNNLSLSLLNDASCHELCNL